MAHQTARYRKTFNSPYEQHANRIGQSFTVLSVIDKPDESHDEECLPMYRVRFEDGTEIEAWPEEVIVGAWTNSPPGYNE